MRRSVPFILVPVLALLSMGCYASAYKKPCASPQPLQRGRELFIPEKFSLAVGGREMARNPIPYERLDCSVTSHCVYTVFPCEPWTVSDDEEYVIGKRWIYAESPHGVMKKFSPLDHSMYYVKKGCQHHLNDEVHAFSTVPASQCRSFSQGPPTQ